MVKKIFCVGYNIGEKYWDKYYDVQEEVQRSKIEVGEKRLNNK